MAAPRVVVREASVSDAPLSVDRLLAQVSDPQVGGIGLFVGVVRDHDHGTSVTSLDYTAHPSAAAALAACAERTAAAYDVLSVAVSHRTGHLEVGDLAVVVAVGAAHREAALEACRHLIDTLKEQVPIWKEQELTDGRTEWVGLA
ncbi:molybdenum cofactor biosynthesis protein MoaE [Microlunatus flavus]|uniref:Molybdopterin synthase catalytic subunit n=1 Tax=Microlunatus flavus TaxID=1036181 RepID=A0A1H9I0X5_9ACTN|nr:molybdenum cofactor biosynthesis protein MoaE [Microlunatus flavus]SEQ68256.1 molybdopterin synthase catalytic subunit [Microlunatus flavus]